MGVSGGLGGFGFGFRVQGLMFSVLGVSGGSGGFGFRGSIEGCLKLTEHLAFAYGGVSGCKIYALSFGAWGFRKYDLRLGVSD